LGLWKNSENLKKEKEQKNTAFCKGQSRGQEKKFSKEEGFQKERA